MVRLHLDGALVRENDIIERVLEMLASPCKPFYFVAFSDMLAIHTPPKRPSQRRSTAKYHPQGYTIALLSEDAVKLHSCSLVQPHLFYDDSLDFGSHLGRSARPNASVDVASLFKLKPYRSVFTVWYYRLYARGKSFRLSSWQV